MSVFMAGIHKMLVRIANREDPFWQATGVQNFRTFSIGTRKANMALLNSHNYYNYHMNI